MPGVVEIALHAESSCARRSHNALHRSRSAASSPRKRRATTAGLARQAPASPAWAYGVPPLSADGTSPARARARGAPAPPAAPRQPDTSLKHVPGSTQEFTLAHIRDYWDVGDWFPEDHPPMPNVVVHGRQPHVRGCAMCHMPNGKGRPENAPVAGQPYVYIVQQLHDFKNDLRTSAETRASRTPPR